MTRQQHPFMVLVTVEPRWIHTPWIPAFRAFTAVFSPLEYRWAYLPTCSPVTWGATMPPAIIVPVETSLETSHLEMAVSVRTKLRTKRTAYMRTSAAGSI